MHMAVNTAISPQSASSFCIKVGMMPKAAPAEPKAVTGTAMDSALEKPKSGWRIPIEISVEIYADGTVYLLF